MSFNELEGLYNILVVKGAICQSGHVFNICQLSHVLNPFEEIYENFLRTFHVNTSPTHHPHELVNFNE